MRTAEWYYKAYSFLAKFNNYTFLQYSYLEGQFTRICLRDNLTHEWLGPELEYSSAQNKFVIDHLRRL